MFSRELGWMAPGENSLGPTWGPFCVLVAMAHEDEFPEETLVPGRPWIRILPSINALGGGSVVQMEALNPLVEIPHHDSFPLPITLGKLLAFELGGTNFHPELSVPPIYSWARG